MLRSVCNIVMGEQMLRSDYNVIRGIQYYLRNGYNYCHVEESVLRSALMSRSVSVIALISCYLL